MQLNRQVSSLIILQSCTLAALFRYSHDQVVTDTGKEEIKTKSKQEIKQEKYTILKPHHILLIYKMYSELNSENILP